MRTFFLFSVFIVSLIGCGKNHVALSGRVVYSDTGEPLNDGMVSFIRPDFQARGFINREGRYIVGSYKERDGLPPGEYRVCVTCSLIGPSGEAITLIAPKYAEPDSSGLRINIDSTTKTYDIKVDRAVGKQ